MYNLGMSYLKGEVRFKVYENEQNSYAIYKVDIEESDEDVFKYYRTCSVTGYFYALEIGTTYKFNGEVIESKKYGYTFKCDTYERVLPTSKIGLIEFLSGDMFKGIGVKVASDIVNTLGTDCIKMIMEDKDVLDRVSSINKKKKDIVYTALINNFELEEILVKLYTLGISPKFALRIYDKYKDKTLNVIQENPYQLIDDIDGIAFLKADKIALNMGVNPKSEARIEACISYTLYDYAESTGNTYLYKDELIQKTKYYLGFTRDDIEELERCLDNLIKKGKIIDDNNLLQDYKVYHAEKYISSKLKLMNSAEKSRYYDEEIESLIGRLESKYDLQYEETQKDAVKNALKNNISIITGGPGTGKTTIEKCIIYCFKELSKHEGELYGLCAPTGKAAKRIEESTGYKATTIHKLLGYDREGNYEYNRFNPLPHKLIVVDEASMVDIFLFERLLEALQSETRLVIVGDSDQLPSIGPGQVLRDLIDSKCFKTTKLTKIHRQKQNSKIISLAYDILDEEIKTEIDPLHQELSFINADQGDLKEILQTTINHFLGLGYKLESDIQVLIPMYKGGAGIDSINDFLQQAFNPNNIEVNYKRSDDDKTKYLIDDKVIQLVNQYEDSVMNGDMGVISDILGKKEVVVDFQGNKVKYKGQDISNISLAYAISIHKSQGSEFPVVILPIFPSYRVMLNKKLLYTAVTRAKDYLVLIGDFLTLNRCIKVLSEDRKTRIKDFVNN